MADEPGRRYHRACVAPVKAMSYGDFFDASGPTIRSSVSRFVVMPAAIGRLIHGMAVDLGLTRNGGLEILATLPESLGIASDESPTAEPRSRGTGTTLPLPPLPAMSQCRYMSTTSRSHWHRHRNRTTSRHSAYRALLDFFRRRPGRRRGISLLLPPFAQTILQAFVCAFSMLPNTPYAPRRMIMHNRPTTVD